MAPEDRSPASLPLPFRSATELLEALAAGTISAVELCELHLQRIARHDPSLNAIATLSAERALGAARRADDAHARGVSLGPLHGLPITIKEAIDVCGLPTTSGLPERARATATTEGPAVAALLASGSVLLGKTNVPPRTADWQTENRLFGRTHNPWDPERTPGGSTGGGAAALAAGLTALELGSDLGGSIRVPAAFCGVYGHRPSETLVPRHGHVPGTPVPNPAVVMGVLGPLARDPRDLEVALSVIAGAVPGEDVAWHVALPPPRHTRLSGFRVAVLPEVSWLPLDAAVRSAMDRTVAALQHGGAQVAPAQPAGLSIWQHHELYAELIGAMLFADLPDPRRPAVAATMRRAAAGTPPNPFAAATANGVLASAPRLISLLQRREHYRLAYRTFFHDWDILLAPVVPVPPFRHLPLGLPVHQRTLTLDRGRGPTIPYAWLAVLPGLASMSGQPATAFPAGRTPDGLPVGLQAIGPYLEDRTPIAFARLLSEVLGGYQPPPGFG